MRSRRVLVALAAALVTATTAGCGSSSGGPAAGAPSGTTTRSTVTGRITVFAAASLEESFTTIGTAFRAAHPGVQVTFSFGPSSGLATQIVQGAPADVFAAASTGTMQRVLDAKAATGATPFATNQLRVAVPVAPGRVTALADLARPDVKVALCQPQVPCGTVAASVLRNAGLQVRPVTLEADVKAVLTKVRLGEVDAGLVYVTDVLAAGDAVRGIEVPAAVNASTTYPIAAITGSTNAPAGQAFIDYVLSADGRAVLGGAGFGAP